MKQFTTGRESFEVEGSSALLEVQEAFDRGGRLYGAYVGLDVHKEKVAVAVAECGRDKPRYEGEVLNTAKQVSKLIDRLSRRYGGERLLFVYEAGAMGYVLYRQILLSGHDCEVVAPSLIPRKAGDRVKTDRRDALSLSRLARSGDLTRVWVPDEEQESLRDLTRAREDMKAIETKARQRLGAFLLRHGQVYREGSSRWTQRHFRWQELACKRFAGNPGAHRSIRLQGRLLQVGCLRFAEGTRPVGACLQAIRREPRCPPKQSPARQAPTGRRLRSAH